MRVDSYAQTPVARGGIAHKALCVLMALVLALGLTPIARGQAWAGNSKIQATMGVESTSKAENTIEGSGELNLKAKMTDFTYDGKQYLSGGFGVSYTDSGLRSSDFEGFTVQWFTKAPGESEYTKTNSTSVGSDGWNSQYNYPSSSTVYQTGTKTYNQEGTYSVYCVAMDGEEEVSDRLQYTVAVTAAGGGDEPAGDEFALTGAISPSNATGTVTFVDSWGAELTPNTAKEGDTVYVKVNTTDTANYPISGIAVSGVDDGKVSNATDDFTDYDTYTNPPKAQYYKFTMPAQAVTVTAKFGSSVPTEQTADVRFSVKNANSDPLWEGSGSDYDYTVSVSEKGGTEVSGNYDYSYYASVFALTVGKTYEYTLTPNNTDAYATTTGELTVAADQGSVVNVVMKSAGSTEPTVDPTLTLVVKPAAAAQYVQLYTDELLTVTDGKVNIPAGTEVEVAFQTAGTKYSLESVEVTGAEINTYGGTGYYFEMPSSDATCTVTLSGGETESEKFKISKTLGDGVGSMTFEVGGAKTDEAAKGDVVTVVPIIASEEYDSNFTVTVVNDTTKESVEATLGSKAYNGEKWYFTMPDSSVTVTASAKAKAAELHTLAVESEDEDVEWEAPEKFELGKAFEIAVKTPGKAIDGIVSDYYADDDIAYDVSSDGRTVSVTVPTDWYDDAGYDTLTITLTFKDAGSDPEPETYTITWKNWDGTTLATTKAKDGETPEYTGATPTRAADASYTYAFSGWTPAVAKVTADASYTATFKATAKPLDLSKAAVSVSGSYAYTGSAVLPAAGSVKVTLGGKQVPASGYSVSFGNNVNAGTAAVTVTGKGAYAGTAKGSFTIAPKQVAAPAAKRGLKYTGKTQAGVAAGAGYTLKGNTGVNAGSYKATATPKANYAWTGGSTAAKAIGWSIAQAKTPLKAKTHSKSVKASAVKKKAQTLKLAVSSKSKGKVTYKAAGKASKGLTLNAKTGALTLKKGSKAGTYSVKVKATQAAKGNYAANTCTFTAKIVVKK